MPSAMLCNGVPCEVRGVDLRTWHTTGLLFDHATVRRRRTALVCVHWTGATNPAHRVFENMSTHRDARGRPDPYSVHFVIDPLGIVWQMMDASIFGAHAQGVNDRAIGIELIGKGDDLRGETWTERDTVIERIHGENVRYRAFTPAQTGACIKLVEALCGVYELPMVVPERGGDVLAAVMPARELAGFRGVIGHLHTKKTKRDPGLRILRAIQARGMQLAQRGGGDLIS